MQRGVKRGLQGGVQHSKMVHLDNSETQNRTKTLPTPIKSDSDKKEYRLIQLENGLKALLIDARNVVCHTSTIDSEEMMSSEEESEAESDVEETEEEEILAACSLMIDVGSFSDPPEIQGLAHFLEHMIFMGSEKYPEENDFDQFINKCGGSSNADTDCEETSFYFEVTEKHLDEALDRFSQLFISPLMSRDAMGREKEAVDSEFQQKINNEGSRREQLLASFGNKSHPCSIFTWGNLITLKECIDDDTLYTEVHKFRKLHYSAHRMYVAIQARQDLDSLQALVERYFSKIASNLLSGKDFTQFSHENAFESHFTQKFFYVKAKSDMNKLDVTWCLPSIMGKYKTKPEEYVSFLIGHEGKGSLCSFLRRNLLALEVRAGIDFSGFEHNSMYSLFMINIILTDFGLENVEKVLKVVFSYLKLLETRPVSEDLFQELQQIELNSFKFQTEKQAIDNVEDFVVNVKYYEPEDVLNGPSLYFEYSEKDIRDLITRLNERKFNVMITTTKPCPGIEYNCKEKWFGTEYCAVDFPHEWEELWKAREVIPELYMPEKNEFVPSNFEILEPSPVIYPTPQKIIDTDVIELWHRQDDKFFLPHAHIYFYFMNDFVQKSPVNAAKLNLLSLVLRYYLVEALYPATMTGVEYQSYSAELGYVMKVYGFNEKLHKIFEIMVQHLSEIDKIMEKSVVEVMKTQLLKNYHNTFIKPSSLNRDLRLFTLEEFYNPSFVKYNHLLNITFEDLKTFACEFKSHLNIRGLVQGNVSAKEAAHIGETIQKYIPARSLPVPIETRANELPFGQSTICVRSLQKCDMNSTITSYYQLGKSSLKLTALTDMLVSLIEEPLFDTLRTKEQLGYDVAISVRDTFNILGITITVKSQENKFTSTEVDARIASFSEEIVKILTEMGADDFELARDSLIKLKALPDTELKEEMQRNWTEITEEEYLFDRRFREIEHLKKITQADVIEFYKNLIQNKRKLSIQVIGDEVLTGEGDFNTEPSHKPVELEYCPRGLNFVTDVEVFKRTLTTFPAVKTLID